MHKHNERSLQFSEYSRVTLAGVHFPTDLRGYFVGDFQGVQGGLYATQNDLRVSYAKFNTMSEMRCMCVCSSLYIKLWLWMPCAYGNLVFIVYDLLLIFNRNSAVGVCCLQALFRWPSCVFIYWPLDMFYGEQGARDLMECIVIFGHGTWNSKDVN